MIGALLRILAALVGLPSAVVGWWKRLRVKRLEGTITRQKEKLESQERNFEAKRKALEAAHKVQNETKDKPLSSILDYLSRGGK